MPELKMISSKKVLTFIKSENKKHSSYLFGFQGQLKTDEISGSGNHTTAEFWEYDARLGRRWNLDPVKKSWQSPYACFSDNPIWKLDPNGDDDYFNSKGQLVKRTKTGTKIVVMTAKGNLSFSQFTAMNNKSKNYLYSANIVGHYAKQIGYNGTSGVSPHSSKNDKLAFANKNGIWVSTKGGASPLFNDYNNLKSGLNHEQLHKKAGDPSKLHYTFMDHAKIYEEQMGNAKVFGKTTNKFKIGQAANYARYLLGAYTADEIDADQLANKMETFNETYDKYGLRMSPNWTTVVTGTSITVDGKNNTQSTVKAVKDSR